MCVLTKQNNNNNNKNTVGVSAPNSERLQGSHEIYTVSSPYETMAYKAMTFLPCLHHKKLWHLY